MELSSEDRGILEKSIDSQIEGIPGLISIFRDPETKKFLQYKDETDVVFGMIWGAIFEKFGLYYTVLYKTEGLPPEISKEVTDTIVRRASEIREAIFRCG